MAGPLLGTPSMAACVQGARAPPRQRGAQEAVGARRIRAGRLLVAGAQERQGVDPPWSGRRARRRAMATGRGGGEQAPFVASGSAPQPGRAVSRQ